MLARRRLGTTLLSYSRQNLPRPFRLYSSPSLRRDAPATETASTATPSYPAFLPSDNEVSPLANDMQGFLKRRMEYTMLPTPLPDDRSSKTNDYYFTDSPTQDLLAVIDTCLHNLYDVRRAKQVFERLREKKRGDPVLETRLYNSFLEAFIDMATEKEPYARDMWIEEAWALFDIMESGREKVQPNPGTYAVMLIAWLRFNVDSVTPVEHATSHTPTSILSSIIDRQLSVSNVVADRAFTSNEDAAAVIKLLSKAAVDMNLSRVVSELGQAEAIGSQSDPLEDVPEVRPVLRPVKRDAELGNEQAEEEEPSEIPFNLDILRKHLANVALARRVLPSDAAARQKLLEESVYDVAVARLKYEAEKLEDLGLNDQVLNQADLQKWMWDWHQKLVERLQTEVKDVIAHESRMTPKQQAATPQLGSFLMLVKPQKLSLITILELMRLQGTGGVADGMKTARALLAVGRAIEVEYKAEMCRKHKITIPGHVRPSDVGVNGNSTGTSTTGSGSGGGFFSQPGYRDLHRRRMANLKYMEEANGWGADWTQQLRVRVGSIMVECLMDVATVTRHGVDKQTGQAISEDHPAFFHSYEYVRGQKLGVIRLNPIVAERIAKDNLRETLHPRHLPMLVKPKPWVDHDQGGYLYNKTSAMRYKDSQEQQSYLRHASALGNVELVYAGLDVLGSTPWAINRRIFDVVLTVWNSGERLGKLPPAVFDGAEPVKPVGYDTDPAAKSVYMQRHRAYNKDKASNHSDRCSVNYKIEIARAFLGDIMYLPHNLDFRGRAYPVPPHLNHIGDDLSRGLLKFGESRPLGERGLRWLKIHLANLFGFDKGSFDERVEFVHQHLEDIYDSAQNPLDGKKWWTKADDPWQCLATCMELHSALTSPDPHAFMSALPVHQDGTCNGLQHYAALGGDAQGAQQVNLGVTDRPSDVYTHVAEMVRAIMAEDAKKGHKYALMLEGKVSRKVVKQTVMTTVYGVTFVGARDQIEKQLKDGKNIPEEECWGASSYLAKNVLSCIGDLFSGAKDIQNWLNLCARLISKSIPDDRIPEAVSDHIVKRGKGRSAPTILAANRIKKEQMTSVVWTTPLGLPIVQPYRKTKRRQIMTSIQTVFISDPNSPAEVNSIKQASAFPPNFIHSLDATHMMLTALECRTQDLTFASVHDSYWTHASSIDKMSGIIRDTFIALHSSDVLVKLQAEFQERYKGYKIPLVSLKAGKLTEQLVRAGAKIALAPAQAKALEAEDDLEASTDAIASIEEISEDATAEDTGDESESECDSRLTAVTRPKGRRKEAAKDDPHAVLMDKFVDLVDLLPPLPKKGQFQVSTIKKSQYFFS